MWKSPLARPQAVPKHDLTDGPVHKRVIRRGGVAGRHDVRTFILSALADLCLRQDHDLIGSMRGSQKNWRSHRSRRPFRRAVLAATLLRIHEHTRRTEGQTRPGRSAARSSRPTYALQMSEAHDPASMTSLKVTCCVIVNGRNMVERLSEPCDLFRRPHGGKDVFRWSKYNFRHPGRRPARI
ncbi:hypothetical protein M433DRAFT_131844 [Acidomyces richmondensis BFW]|nr:hypothetical protein M433DRAFT_131844 [Acidomyces richmondensis BFW]